MHNDTHGDSVDKIGEYSDSGHWCSSNYLLDSCHMLPNCANMHSKNYDGPQLNQP